MVISVSTTAQVLSSVKMSQVSDGRMFICRVTNFLGTANFTLTMRTGRKLGVTRLFMMILILHQISERGVRGSSRDTIQHLLQVDTDLPCV